MSWFFELCNSLNNFLKLTDNRRNYENLDNIMALETEEQIGKHNYTELINKVTLFI